MKEGKAHSSKGIRGWWQQTLATLKGFLVYALNEPADPVAPREPATTDPPPPSSPSSEEHPNALQTFVAFYTKIAQENYTRKSEELSSVLNILIGHMKALGIHGKSAPQDGPFDPATMEVSFFDPVPTDDPAKEGCVAQSIVPAFRLRKVAAEGEPEEIPLNKELVVLYKVHATPQLSTARTAETTTMGTTARPSTKNVPAPQPDAYLVHQQYGEITGIIPVAEGMTVYGLRPKAQEGRQVRSIRVPQGELEDEHFSITLREDQVSAKLLAGTWAINYEGNDPQETPLENGDKIIIGDNIFIFIN